MPDRAQLKTDLGVWAKRGSITDLPLDQFIDFAFDKIKREVEPNQLDQAVTIDPDLATNVRGSVWAHALPADANSVWAFSNNGERMRTLRSDALLDRYGRGGNTNQPAFYSVVGSEIWTGPGVGGDLLLVYNAQDAAFPADNNTNYGMENYYDAYLWCAMGNLHAYGEDQEQENAAYARYNSIAANVNMIATKRRRGGGATGTS